jgi:hypothetical protein
MKLFEIASPGDARTVLSVIQGLSDRKKIPSEIPFSAFKNYINGDEIGIGTPAALVAFKNAVDPAGDVISDVLDNGTVILNTKIKSKSKDAATDTSNSPTIDAMASQAAKAELNKP